MTNEFGERLDSNGYAESLLNNGTGCWYCRLETETARHEAFEGTGRREKSKRLGLWANVCPICHGLCHEHPRGGVALLLKQTAQRAAMDEYGWTTDRFIHEFGQNYLED